MNNYNPGSYRPGSTIRERLRHRPLSVKQAAGRNERLAAAACHLSILLNLFTYAGGIVVCLLLYLGAVGRARYLADQASRALLGQVITWGIIGAGWALFRILPEWLGSFLFAPYSAIVWFVVILLEMWKAARCL